MTTPTASATQQQLDDYLGESVRALPAGATLGAPVTKLAPLKPDPLDDDVQGLVKPQASRWVEGVEPSGNATYLERFATHWVDRGWQIAADERPRAYYVDVKSPEGYGLSMQTTPDGRRLSINGSAPWSRPS